MLLLMQAIEYKYVVLSYNGGGVRMQHTDRGLAALVIKLYSAQHAQRLLMHAYSCARRVSHQ